jgi:hypothetical protein
MPGQNGAGQNGAAQNGTDEAARLEAALPRIARAAAKPRPVPLGFATDRGRARLPDAASSGTSAERTADVAARLDSLIAELRDVLGATPL